MTDTISIRQPPEYSASSRHTLPDATEEEKLESLNLQRNNIEDICYSCSTTVKSSELVAAINEDLDFSPESEWTRRNLDVSVLINEREKHQTEAAAKGIRTGNSAPLGPDQTNVSESKQSIRQDLMRRFQQIVRTQQEQGIGTGLERKARHNMAIPQIKKAGNSLNAALAGKINASDVGISYCRFSF